MAQLTNSTLRDQINRLRSQPEDLFNDLLDRTVIEEELEQEGCSVSIKKARQMASHSSPPRRRSSTTGRTTKSCSTKSRRS